MSDYLFDDEAPTETPDILGLPQVRVMEVPGWDAALLAARETEKKRRYLGASAVGYPCERRVAYGMSIEQSFPPRLLGIFRLGHAIETEVEATLRAAGWEFLAEVDGKQIGYATHGGRHRGHCDGLLLNAPGLPGPRILEVKSMNAARWNEARKKGVAASHPVYYDQCQMYMRHIKHEGRDLTQHPAVLLAYNKNTSEVCLHVIPFDRARADFLDARVARVLAAENPEDIARVARDPSDFRCKMCPFASRCWRMALPEITPDDWS